MGLLDSLLGRTKPVRANLDALFALPSAAVTLQTSAGLVSSGHAGVCWKPPAGQGVADLQREIAQLLEIDDTGHEFDAADDGTTTTDRAPGPPGTGGPAAASPGVPAVGELTQAEDEYGYRWLLLDDDQIDDLVTRVHLVNTTLTEAGWGPQLLCSVFGFTPGADAGSDVRPLYLVYLYKRGTFYPFAPSGKEQRDTEYELRVRSLLGVDLPVEADLSRWFPLWDLPVR